MGEKRGRDSTMKRSVTCLFVVWLCLCCCCHLALGVTVSVDCKSVVLKEKETVSEELLEASCSPTSPATACSIRLSTVDRSLPCSSCFGLYPCNTDKFCLRFLPGQGSLNARIKARYTLTLVASDLVPSQAFTQVDVHIQPNSPPFFDPRDFPNKQLHVTETLSNSGSVTVQAKDTDDDAMIYTMETVPPNSGVEIDSLSGVIRATRDLKYECRPYVTGKVYVRDSYHNELSDPLAVTLNFAEFNTRPIINNLNREIYVREDEAVGEIVMPFAAYDETDPPTLTYTFSTIPSTAADLFKIVGNDLLVNAPLDYESYPNGITMSIQASDGFCDSQFYRLVINLVDINEPPFLLPVDQTLESCEGKVEIRPVWTNASDPDVDDVIRFTNIQPNDNGRLSIDEETGVVSTTIDYDLDVDKLAPTVVTVVTVTDRQGETATATLTIRFRDCNDNAPFFVTPTRAYLVRDCWPAGSVVGTVPRTTDLDSTFQQNNVFAFSGSGAGAQVQESGSIVIMQQFTTGQSVTFPIYATDKGQEPGPLRSRAFWASLYTLPCLETDPTDTNSNNNNNNNRRTTTAGVPVNDVGYWNIDGGNLPWIIMALLLAALLPALLLFLGWRYWGKIRAWLADRGPCCPRARQPDLPPPRAVTPIRKPTPPPEKKGPGFIFGWWKEMYRDNDYERKPRHDNIPEPSKGIEPVDTNTYDPAPEDPPPPRTPTPPPPRKTCVVL